MSDKSTIQGGKLITVTFDDGTSEEIKIRALKVKEIVSYQENHSDDAKLLQIFTGKDEAWCNRLTAESQDLVLQEGDAVNRGFSERRTKARIERMDLVMPGASKAMQQQLDRLVNGSLTLPSPADLPSTKQAITPAIS